MRICFETDDNFSCGRKRTFTRKQFHMKLCVLDFVRTSVNEGLANRGKHFLPPAGRMRSRDSLMRWARRQIASCILSRFAVSQNMGIGLPWEFSYSLSVST